MGRAPVIPPPEYRVHTCIAKVSYLLRISFSAKSESEVGRPGPIGCARGWLWLASDGGVVWT